MSAPRRVNEKGTLKSLKMSPISCITASVRPDGLGVCSKASSVSDHPRAVGLGHGRGFAHVVSLVLVLRN